MIICWKGLAFAGRCTQSGILKVWRTDGRTDGWTTRKHNVPPDHTRRGIQIFYKMFCIMKYISHTYLKKTNSETMVKLVSYEHYIIICLQSHKKLSRIVISSNWSQIDQNHSSGLKEAIIIWSMSAQIHTKKTWQNIKFGQVFWSLFAPIHMQYWSWISFVKQKMVCYWVDD